MPSKITETPPSTVAELEAALLAGDSSVTAQALALAQAEQDRQQLLAEAHRRQEATSAEAARQAKVAELRRRVEGLVDDRPQLHDRAVEAVEALTALWEAARRRGELLDRLALEARGLGIASMPIDDTITDPSGVGWRRDAAAIHAGPARLRVGDTLIGAVAPERIVARVVVDALARIGKPASALNLANAGPPLVEQIDSQVRVIEAPATARVRVLKRWGAHQPGALVAVDTESAKWAVQRHFAELVA